MPSITCPARASRSPSGTRADGAEAWLHDYLHREGVSPEELLPTPLRLRKEIERLTATIGELHTEQQVREIATELNRQILQWRRIPEGPPVYLRLLDPEELVSRWREARALRGRGAVRRAACGARHVLAPLRRWRRRHQR